MNSEVFLNENFSENDEKVEGGKSLIKRINFSCVRVLICCLIFIGLLFCRHSHMAYYTEISKFYSANFKSEDEKISEIKNSILEKLENLHLKIKFKINNL